MRALARCEEGCRDPSAERMSFVDAHQASFASHGACARAADDPTFDRECFSGKGETFESSLTKAATDPMTCGYPASEFRPYASRARWIRTANDSYFTAMTYPEGLPSAAPPRAAPAIIDNTTVYRVFMIALPITANTNVRGAPEPCSVGPGYAI
jgi:hypothetical protein